jgi:putative oxidoreductase
VTFVFHNFWAVPAEQQQMEMVNFLKNLAIGGGLPPAPALETGILPVPGAGSSNAEAA